MGFKRYSFCLLIEPPPWIKPWARAIGQGSVLVECCPKSHDLITGWGNIGYVTNRLGKGGCGRRWEWTEGLLEWGKADLGRWQKEREVEWGTERYYHQSCVLLIYRHHCLTRVWHYWAHTKTFEYKYSWMVLWVDLQCAITSHVS